MFWAEWRRVATKQTVEVLALALGFVVGDLLRGDLRGALMTTASMTVGGAIGITGLTLKRVYFPVPPDYAPPSAWPFRKRALVAVSCFVASACLMLLFGWIQRRSE